MLVNLSQPIRRLLLSAVASAAVVLTLVPIPSFAYDEGSPAATNVDAKGVALKGYDPVSYFSGRKPVHGKANITAQHDGATYYFASVANRNKFQAAPEQYAPQFGGFCAMGVALGKKLDADPMRYRVVNDKLYLNVSKHAQTRWLDDVPGNIENAEKGWPALKDTAPKDL